ncbi:MAG: O-antigen ligase family protein [Planctomycetota bacterium]
MRAAFAETLRWTGAIGIATVAVMRCVVTFAPRLLFDVDPAIDPTPLPGLGPGGSLVLDCLLLAMCGCGLLGEALSRRGIDWRLLALALIPAPVILWHGAHDALDLWRGSTWLAAAVACAVVAHLGRDRTLRAILIALLVSVLVPIVLRGASQSAFNVGGLTLRGPEYADTIAEFEANQDLFFADRGWTPDSPAAQIYERRLRQPDPRGWFPTTNIYASMMAFGLVLFVGLAVASIRNGVGRRWLVAFCLGAVIAGGALSMSRSKGAVLASAAGLALLCAPWAGAQLKTLFARHGGLIAVVLVAATLLGVVFRGAVLPESWLGEKSLLFRWHYLVGAGRVVSDHLIAGVGPDGFQSAYTAVRVPRSPEEVASAHSMFADWLAMLGVLGAAWLALVFILVWRGGGSHDTTGDDTGDAPAPASPRLPLLAAAIVAVLGLMSALPFEAADMDTLGTEIGRGAGILGYVSAAAGLGLVLGRMRSPPVDRALGCAAVVLVIHGQIEMTFFDPGSVTWMMCILGLAGGAVARPAGPRPGMAVSIVLVVFAVGLLLVGARGVLMAQARIFEAARLLYPPEETPRDLARQREQAAGLLGTAYDLRPSWVMPLDEAVKQLLVAATLVEGPRRLELIDNAFAHAERAVADHGKPTSIARAGEAAWFRATETGEPDDWQRAIELNRRLTDLDPHGISSWQRYGDALWEGGRRDEAATAYQRALDNDANFELDPLKQLSARDRNALRQRIDFELDPLKQLSARDRNALRQRIDSVTDS